MRMLICAVYDHKVQAYMTPFFVRSRGEAIRSFEDACMDEKHSFSRHAQDYDLFIIGEFEDDDASVRAVQLHNLGSASDYVRPNRSLPADLKVVEK